MRKLKSSWLFENGKAAIKAEIDYSAETYSIMPNNGEGAFTFKNQRLPNGLCGPVAGLIVQAGLFCESELRRNAEKACGCDGKQSGCSKCSGPSTMAKLREAFGLDARSEMLDMVDSATGERLTGDQHPDEITHPNTGETLVKVATIKPQTRTDAVKNLIEKAGVSWAPEAAKTLTERLMAPERATTLEVGIQGSSQKIEVPGVVDYGLPPEPQSVSVPDVGLIPDPNAPPVPGQTYTCPDTIAERAP